MKQIIKRISVIFLLVLAVASCLSHTCKADQKTTDRRKQVLFISAYAYDWESVPYQLEGVDKVLSEQVDIEYAFMNTKKFTYNDIKSEFYRHIKKLIELNGQYDLIITEDDAALDFVLENRNDLFRNIPVVFMGINTEDKANAAHKDPLITGMIECFPYKETIALASQLFPKATKIVGISDSTVSGRGCSERFFAEQKNFPQLEFSEIVTSKLSRDELKNAISKIDDTCILVFMAMVNDGDGNLYSLKEATEFVENNSKIPIFKADMVGIGMGIFGGFVSSYEDMGESAGEQALLILNGESPADIPVSTMGGYPMFDQNIIDKYGMSVNSLPSDSVIINRHISFLEQYRMEILIFAVVVLFIIILLVTFLAVGRKKMNDRLTVVVEEARTANREKNDFLARMSHDMRTPMNTIVNLTKMVEEELNNPEMAMSDLKNIETANQFLLGLIDDILDMSRIESGKLKLHPERYTYKEFLDYMKFSFMPVAEKRGIELNITPGTECVDIMIDKVRFNQVCFNLVSNALKYTEEGGHVNFVMEHGNVKNGVLPCTITVSDDGIGMSKEFQKTMFLAFAQEGRSYKTIEGAGLGLSIVKSILDVMGGTISVWSELGKGSIFTVKLDMLLAGKEENQKEDETDFSVLKGKHILLTEDHHMNQEIAKRLLLKMGMTVEIAENGQIAVDKFSSNPDAYDAILMDLRMPVMDGLGATRTIRALDIQKAKTVPIISMTANAFDSDIEDCMRAGMNAHLEKPIEQTKLYIALAKEIDKQ